jgi:hypothetical protein
MKTIDATPTWEGILPLLLENAASKNEKVRTNTLEELKRMAQLADKYNQCDKKSIEKAIDILSDLLGLMTQEDEMGNTKMVFDPIYRVIHEKHNALLSQR